MFACALLGLPRLLSCALSPLLLVSLVSCEKAEKPFPQTLVKKLPFIFFLNQENETSVSVLNRNQFWILIALLGANAPVFENITSLPFLLFLLSVSLFGCHVRFTQTVPSPCDFCL